MATCPKKASDNDGAANAAESANKARTSAAIQRKKPLRTNSDSVIHKKIEAAAYGAAGNSRCRSISATAELKSK